MKISKAFTSLIFAMVAFLAVAADAKANLRGLGNGNGNGPPRMDFLYYEGSTVRTLAPPAAAPMEGIDNLYVVTNGVDGQLAITAVAPGDTDYHGGKWAFYFVTFPNDVYPILLTSADMVAAARMDGKVVVTRVPEMDFKCPIQP